MSVFITQLPTGTDITRCINLPACGGWLGNVSVSLITPVNATIAELLLIYPNHPDGKIRYRRTGGSIANNYSNWTLQADRKTVRWLVDGECALKIRYTATAEISLSVETTRLVQPYAYPPIPATAHPTENSVAIANVILGKVYWKTSA